jgi:predicted alpha/beta hydrolase family esterase
MSDRGKNGSMECVKKRVTVVHYSGYRDLLHDMSTKTIKKQIFFIHGGNAYSRYDDFLDDLRTKPLRDLPGSPPSSRWDSTLDTTLGESYELFKPSMPNSKNAHYLEWKIWFERYHEYLRNGVILIGWSLGGYFLAKYFIEETPCFRPKALLLLAAPYKNDVCGTEDGGDFAFDTSRVGEVLRKVDTMYILHSSDDLVVPVTHAHLYAKALPTARIVLFSDKNHFIVPEFPELISLIQTLD